MKWFEWLEARRALLVGGISTIGAMALAVSARRNIVSFDSFWHLQMGKDWIENGLSPWVDHYSFTFAGHEISSPPVVFQALLYWFVEHFGQVPGYELLKFSCFALTLAMVLLYLKQIRAAVFVYLIAVPMVAALIELRASVRPELISQVLLVAALMLYVRANGKLNARTILPIALLMGLWSNYHNPVFGYVIFFGFFVDAAVRQVTSRAQISAWLRWLAWGFLVLAVGFLRPGFSHPLHEMVLFDPAWQSLIQEYTSPLLYKGVAAVYALMAMTLIAIVLAIRQRRIGYIVIIAVLVYGASNMARLVTPAGIVITCLFAHLVSEVDWRRSFQRLDARMSWSGLAMVLALVALPTWTTVSLARDFMAENKESDMVFPRDVVRHMKGNDRAGRIFNEYQIGGFLIYHTSPESTVYIDGRTDILYPVAHYKQLLRAQNLPAVFREEADKYDISLAILENDPTRYFVMSEAEDFHLDFVGSRYSLFVRQDPMFPNFGRLMGRPACWNEELVSGLEAEQANAIFYLPPDSDLWGFLNPVMGYLHADDRSAYLRELANSTGPSDLALRFAAYRAVDALDYELAVSLLSRVGTRRLKDHLAAALSMLRLQDFDNAERTLAIASQAAWPYIELPDIVIMNGLLRELESGGPLTMVADDFVESIDRSMEEAGLGGRKYEVDTRLFCASDGWQDTL